MIADQGDRVPATGSGEGPPALGAGVEALGTYEGSGFKEPPSMVRRPDGQILQLPPLLYEVVEAADGHRDAQEIATIVSQRVQRDLTGDDVQFLIDEKLRPQGVLAAADGTSPPLTRPDPFLAFRYRIGVVSERVSGALGAAFKPLFFAPVVIVVMAGLVAADWWIFFHVGVAQALRQVIYHPGLFLPLLAAITLSAAFHEIGHASACRYGGARPGRMGCGLYLAWPAFYTDVSDAYRLGRRGRLRTDLGGVYFNVVIILICTAVYLANGNLEALLLLIVIEHMEIAHQLLPVIRLDGYYIVADLTGVPDLFARIGPIVRSLAFWRATDPQVTPLKRWVRAAVTAWVLVVVPLLILELVIVLIHLPRILATSWDSVKQLARGSDRAFRAGRVLEGLSDAVQILVLAIPIAGILLMIEQLFRKGSAWAWRATRPPPGPPRPGCGRRRGHRHLSGPHLVAGSQLHSDPARRARHRRRRDSRPSWRSGWCRAPLQRTGRQPKGSEGRQPLHRTGPNQPTPGSSHGGQPTSPGPGAPAPPPATVPALTVPPVTVPAAPIPRACHSPPCQRSPCPDRPFQRRRCRPSHNPPSQHRRSPLCPSPNRVGLGDRVPQIDGRKEGRVFGYGVFGVGHRTPRVERLTSQTRLEFLRDGRAN